MAFKNLFTIFLGAPGPNDSYKNKRSNYQMK